MVTLVPRHQSSPPANAVPGKLAYPPAHFWQASGLKEN
jgi:hypothetical protein